MKERSRSVYDLGLLFVIIFTVVIAGITVQDRKSVV